MKKKGLILSIVSAVLAVLTYISLAFNFIYSEFTPTIGKVQSTTYNLADWQKLMNDNPLKGNVGLWKFSFVLMIISLIVVAIVVVLAFVNLFAKNKIVNLVNRVASIVGIVLFVAFLITISAGGSLYAGSFDTSVLGTYKLVPNVGPVLLGIFGAAATCVTLVTTTLSTKSKKSK